MKSGVLGLARMSFIYWVLAAVAGVVYFVSFDYEAFKQGTGSTTTRIVDATSFKNLRMGIDLRGGTRLVLRVNIEQAQENRLAEIGKAVEKSLRRSNNTAEDKGLKAGQLTFNFRNPDKAFKAITHIKAEFPELDVTSDQSDMVLTLSKGEIARIKASVVERSIDVLRNRMDTMDVKGLSVSQHADSNIVIQLPGKDDITDIKDIIMRTARLEFKIVHDSSHSKESLINRYDGILPSDKVLVSDSKTGDEDARWYLVSIFPDVAGSKIVSANVGYDDERGGSAVIFRLDSEGAREMRDVTRNNIGKPLAIIMDGVVTSAPTIQSEIGRDGRITGVSQKEATKVSKLLRSGALDAPLVIEQESRVGASLGKDSIAQGLFACILALLLVLLISVAFYKTSGLLAVIALFYNMLVLLVFLALCGATLTLPGIAGIVLTVGMAIDSSILIFEQIREAIASHVDFRRAVHEGFSGAMKVILDSNITTFLAGVVLFWYGGPAVRGFAVTLMLGVISTIISGVFFLKSAFVFCLDFLGCKKISV